MILKHKENNSYYYAKTNEAAIKETKTKIKNIIAEGFEKNLPDKDDIEAMNPDGKGVGKFYCNFKVHKSHPQGSIPPERPIISCSGSLLENIGLFVEYHIKNKANKHNTFIKDTPDFLRHIDILNEEHNLKTNTILVTFDISALYTNIPHDEAIECVQDVLNKDQNSKIPTNFIIQLLHIVLKNNLFEFNEEFFIQLIEVAMGSRPSPSIANTFLANKIDPKMVEIAQALKTSV